MLAKKYTHQHVSSFRNKYTPEEREERRLKIERQCKCPSEEILCIVLEKQDQSKLRSFTKPYILYIYPPIVGSV